MFNQEYVCPKCDEPHLLVVVEEEGETIETRGEDFCDYCGHEGLTPQEGT